MRVQIHEDLICDLTQSWLYLPHHHSVRTQVELALWTDSFNRQFCIRELVMVWPWPLGDLVAYFCRLAFFYYEVNMFRREKTSPVYTQGRYKATDTYITRELFFML